MLPLKLYLPLTFVITLFATPLLGQYKTLGPGSCGLGQNNCHAKENRWWKDDAHKETIETLYDDLETAQKYAELSGVGADNLFKGNTNCMRCHGTVISGNENNDVDDGVSCERCHGPGSGYKDPHTEGDPALGVKRPGYIKALKLGLVELKNLQTRATTCVRCHYITDQKVLAAGHSSGARFNYIKGIKDVAKHWDRPPNKKDLDKAPFKKAMKAKGPVKIIAKAPPSPPKKQPGNTPPTNPKPPATRRVARRAPTPPAPPPPPPADPFFPLKAKGPITLEPFPAISDSATVDQLLLIIKKRLELLYQKVRSPK
ncbi:MAG: hypothetical protein D6813_05705 [Calditrichaeota bacterium]|nr:MAG: hypothetical protein D6813_05705 [Calditrichota bacterium]